MSIKFDFGFYLEMSFDFCVLNLYLIDHGNYYEQFLNYIGLDHHSQPSVFLQYFLISQAEVVLTPLNAHLIWELMLHQ